MQIGGGKWGGGGDGVCDNESESGSVNLQIYQSQI
jgi:hypothetical protein